MNAVVAESVLRILDDHVQDGDRYLQRQAHRLITLDELELTPAQRKAREDQLAAYRAGELRGLPTIFGDL